MKSSFLLLVACLFSSFEICAQRPPTQVYIVKQWHLSPGVTTLDIAASARLPQFKNQVNVYKILAGMIDRSETELIISEGCQGNIDGQFTEEHYGWNYKKLQQEKSKKEYADILALIPLKIKVFYDTRVSAICADDKALLKENMLAFSDLRAFIGYYSRLKEFKDKNPKKFKLYADSMFDTAKQKDRSIDPIAFARDHAALALQKAEDLIKRRNERFAQVAEANKDKRPAIVVGGLHAKSLAERLESRGIKTQIIVPDGYSQEDEALLDQIKNLLK